MLGNIIVIPIKNFHHHNTNATYKSIIIAAASYGTAQRQLDTRG